MDKEKITKVKDMPEMKLLIVACIMLIIFGLIEELKINGVFF